MSISLKALYDQVQSIKTSGLNVTSISLGTNGWCFFSNGLQICWGGPAGPSVTYPKAFTTATLNVITGAGNNVSNNLHDTNPITVTKAGFKMYWNNSNNKVRYIAIGYLISNSIRSLLGGGLRCL